VRTFVVAVLAALALGAAPAAAAPGNDAFAAALELTGATGRVTGTNLDAGKEPGEPPHGGYAGGASVWYAWVAPASGQVSFRTEASLDTVLAVYTGAAVDALTPVAANDDGVVPPASELSFSAAAGTRYLVAVDGFGGKVGRFALLWMPAPPNDNLAEAISLPGQPAGTQEGTTTGATVETGEPDHAGVRVHSVWYRWTAPASGLTTFFAGSSPVVAVYTGSRVEDLVPVPRSGRDPSSRQSLDAVAGTVYAIAVDGSDEPDGEFTLTWTPPPAHDAFAAAEELRGRSGRARGTTLGASAEPGERRHGRVGGRHSVWYTWRAPAAGPVRFSTAGSDFDTVLAVYVGARVDELRLIRANDDGGPGLTSRAIFVASRGTVYRIAVDGYRSSGGGFVLAWAPAR